MRLIEKDKLYIFKDKDFGFAIPQVLILGVGIAIGVSGLMAASILGLTGSRFNRQELISKASAYSGITTIRTLLNDSSESSLFHYFWLVNSCSETTSECNESNTANPSKEYWPDNDWCEGSAECDGRQKAPMCPTKNQEWDEILGTYGLLFDTEPNLVGVNLDDSKRDFNQSFNVISTKYTGTESYGISSILIEGIASSNNSETKTASNKLRVNIQVNSDTAEAGFGFLSIGENQLDGEKSLFLGNLTVTPEDSQGSIIWRRNLTDESQCGDFVLEANGDVSPIPGIGNGGIWVQPLGLPKQPRLSNVDDIGILICTPTLIQQEGSNCNLNSEDMSEKVYRIHSLYARGPDSKFEITTKDDSKIVLEIMGDIDISNGGSFCHKDGDVLDSCGSGKAENLTILFKQETSINGNKIVCNDIDDEFTGGVKLQIPSVDFANAQNPIDNNQLPGSSFLIDNTGDNSLGDKFAAFVYGPKMTFLSVRPESQWVQITNSEEGAKGAGMIVTTRASYGLIENTLGDSFDDKMVNIILTPNSNLIPYLGQKDLTGSNDDEDSETEVLGVGYRVDLLPEGSSFNPSNHRVLLIYNRGTKDYHLRTYKAQEVNPGGRRSSEFSYPRTFAKMHFSEENITDKNLGKDLGSQANIPGSNLNAKQWLKIFNIEVMQVEELNINPERNFSGAAWVKNLCFDGSGEKKWEFSQTFVDKLSEWHGEEFNWGVRYYRGRSIILWDTLRDFKS